LRLWSPVTAAGPRRISTVFPVQQKVKITGKPYRSQARIVSITEIRIIEAVFEKLRQGRQNFRLPCTVLTIRKR